MLRPKSETGPFIKRPAHVWNQMIAFLQVNILHLDRPIYEMAGHFIKGPSRSGPFVEFQFWLDCCQFLIRIVILSIFISIYLVIKKTLLIKKQNFYLEIFCSTWNSDLSTKLCVGSLITTGQATVTFRSTQPFCSTATAFSGLTFSITITFSKSLTTWNWPLIHNWTKRF